MAIIAKIELLYLFSGFSGIALYILAIKQFQVPFYKQLSGIDLATFVLYLNLGMLLILLNYLQKLKPNYRLFFVAPMGPWCSGLMILFISLVITSSEWVDFFQMTLLLVLWVYLYINVFRFANGFSWSFKLMIVLGIPLTMVYWSTLVLDFSSNQSLFLDAAVLVFYIVLASFIAEQILGEFKNSIALNLENLQLEIELGARQILSVENERKRMVQDLHHDVITRVANLANQSNQDLLDYNRIEAESNATLQSLRDYSYSLYPPYLEQLTLKNILQRELDRYGYFEPEALIEINEPEANHFDQVFKLWVYRVFKEYLLGFHRCPNPQKLHLCLDFTSNFDWELRIVNQIEGVTQGSPFKALSADIEIYTDYYGVIFEEIDSSVQKGWRFLKEVTEAGKEAQITYVGR
jgi:signal transduction histidine kinase